MKRRACWMLSILGLLSAAASPTRAGVIEKPGFSITLPEGWLEMPNEAVEGLNDLLAKQAQGSGATAPRYDSGFQQDAGGAWMTYPYILVQRQDTGRLSRAQLRSMSSLDTDAMAKKDVKALLKDLATDASMGRFQYDEAANVLRTTAVIQAAFGEVKGLSTWIPTEKGFLLIHAYAPTADFLAHEAIFRQIASSVIPAPDLAYQPRWHEGVPILGAIDWNSVVGRALVSGAMGGIIGGVLVSIQAWKRKKGPATGA